MFQSWRDLLFAHWPVPASELRLLVPGALELDLFRGSGWVGVVPFRMTNVAPRGMPAIPGVSAFPELNVRTYVRRGGQAGVYFFSLDAGSAIAVAAARALFNLPYFKASMRVIDDAGTVRYASERGSAVFEARYRPSGPPFRPSAGTLEHFLTERYCLYNLDRGRRPRRVDIHHPPWELQSAEAEIARNTMAKAAGVGLPEVRPLLHFSKRQDVVAWAPAAA